MKEAAAAALAQPGGPAGLAAPGTRVLLAGTGHHRGPSGLPELPSVSATVTALGEALVRQCGVQPGAVTTLLDPATPADFGHALVRCAEAATGVLLIYYCGHGLVGSDLQLYLATAQTVSEPASLGFSAFGYQQLRQSLAGCQARTIAVVLDCCFAGRAAEPAESAVAALAAPGAAAGSYLLAAASYSENALAPEGEPYTAFGGALIRLLTDGIPDGPRLLTLGELYRALDRTLSDQGRPRPRSRSSGSASDLVVTVNRGYRPPALPVPLPAGEAGAGADAGAPYRGLAAYQEADARFFFGRSKLLDDLRRELAAQLTVPGPLIVLGPSGAGKSSLLRAGLRPSLDDGLPGAAHIRSWPKIVFTPGTDPLGALADPLSTLLATDPGPLRAVLARPAGLAELATQAVRRHAGARDTTGRRLVVIADQFEEVFGPGVAAGQRETFLAALDGATRWPGDGRPPPVLAVAGLRADFYGRALSEPFLAGALTRKRTVAITPMTASELREVIVRPAAAAGLTVEAGLVDRILADLQGEDLGSDAGYDTRLPLLSYALLATWRHREGAALTLRGYQAAGGVGGAVARGAAQLWAAPAAARRAASDDGSARRAAGDDGSAEPLSEAERDIARRLLLQLVHVGPGEPGVTRRRVPLRELAEALGAGNGEPGRAEAVSQVLGKLAAARLVTVDRDRAEIIHDALLRTWPQLREWIEADRVNLAIGQQLSEAAAEWDRLGRHRGDLYSGARLAIARQWAPASSWQLPGLAAEFLRQSLRAADARRRGRIAGLTALVAALAVIAALLVISVSDTAALRARNSTLASGQLAATADELRVTDPELARDLALAAYRLAPTDQAAQSLAEVSVTPAAAEIHAGGGGVPNRLDAAFSPDGRLLAAANGKTGTVTLWQHPESGRPALVGTVRFPAHCVLAFLPRSSILAASCRGVTTLLDLSRPGRPVRTVAFGSAGQPTEAVAVSPDGHWLATGGYRGLVQLWDISHRSRPRLAGTAHLGADVSSLAFSAGSRVLALDAGYQARLARLRGSAPLSHLTAVPGTQGSFAVGFSPSRPELAVAGPGGLSVYRTANLADITSVPVPSGAEPAPPAASVAFGPGGRIIALGLADGGIEVADMTPANQAAQPYTLPGPGITEATAVSPDGRYVAGAGSDGVVRVWDIAPHPAGSVPSGGFTYPQETSPDGHLAVLPASSGALGLWDISAPGRPVLDSLLGRQWAAASFTQQGRVLVTENAAGTALQLWNLANPRSPVRAGRPLRGAGHLAVDVSPYGPLLAIAGTAGNTITVWDISHPAAPARRARITSSALSAAGADGLAPVFLSATVLAAENSAGSALLRWDLAQPGRAAPLPPLPTPGGITGVADASGCRTLATASSGNPVQLWDMAGPRMLRERRIDIASTLFAPGEPLAISAGCVLAEATNAGTEDAVKVWDVRNPASPRLLAVLPVAGTVADLEVSEDSSRVAALIQPPAAAAVSTLTLDVWSVARSGRSHQLAALPVSGDMQHAEFVPHSHLVPFTPPVESEVLPDILDPDPAVSHRLLCAGTQRVLTPAAWSRYAPPGTAYEPPC